MTDPYLDPGDIPIVLITAYPDEIVDSCVLERRAEGSPVKQFRYTRIAVPQTH
jgi:hypothetical protein